MITRTIKNQLVRIIATNRALILNEAQQVTGFMHLLMKPRNTGEAWTSEEKRLLRMHLKHLSCYIPVMAVFAMPFGSLLIPVLAEVLDRRTTRRAVHANDLDVDGRDQAVV